MGIKQQILKAIEELANTNALLLACNRWLEMAAGKIS